MRIFNGFEQLTKQSTKDKPALVYYGWKPFTDADLVNAELLPASTFKIKVE